MIKSAAFKKSKAHIAIIVFGLLTIIWSIISIVFFPLLVLGDAIKKGGIYVREGRVSIEKINPSSPAAFTSLEAGDIIISVNGQKISSAKEFVDLVDKNRGKSISIVAESRGVNKTVDLIPREVPPEAEGPTGLALTDYEFKGGNPLMLTSNVLFQALKEKPNWLAGIALEIIVIIIGIGLIRFKKWALYGFIALRGFLILSNTWFFITTDSLSIIRDKTIFYLSIAFGIAILIFLYSQKKLFR